MIGKQEIITKLADIAMKAIMYALVPQQYTKPKEVKSKYVAPISEAHPASQDLQEPMEVMVVFKQPIHMST